MEMEDKTENGDSIMAAVVRWTNKNIYTCLRTQLKIRLSIDACCESCGGLDEYSETESGELLTPHSRPAWPGPSTGQPEMRGSRAWRRQTQAGTPVCHNKVLLSEENMVM